MSFEKKITSGQFIVLAEFEPPKGVDLSELVVNIMKIKGRVDGVIVPEMAHAVMRMSALGGAALMQQQGMETIMQMCPRDRNRLALQGDILAAYALGVRNLVVIPGEEIKYGDHITAKGIADIDEITLLKAIFSLQNGVDMAGTDLKGSPRFLVGCSINPYKTGKELTIELDMAKKKLDQGVQFLMTQPVFNIPFFHKFMSKASELGVPVIATVFLLKSVGVARYINTNMPGTNIPEEIITRIRKAPDRISECTNISGELIKSLKDVCQGVQLVTTGWENRLPAILDAAGI
jgi:methylenetetrahydrofolate reductase (NADPH)